MNQHAHQPRHEHMTQDEIRPFKSTRIDSMEPDTFDQSQPRIGRRESEPHSLEVGYLHDVLETNFPNHHALLDLHHYFQVDGEEFDVQFDVSFFLDLPILYTLSSYRASEFQNRVPVLAINVMSKSTWRADLSENLDLCGMLRIPVYIVFAPFDVATKFYRPPFARVYQLQTNGSYTIKDIRSNCVDKEGKIVEAHLIDLVGNVPFRIGIEELDSKHEKVKNRYRLVLIHQHSLERLSTRLEQERQRADQEKQRAEKYLRLLKDHGIEP